MRKRLPSPRNATCIGESWTPSGTPWYANAIKRLTEKRVIGNGTFPDDTTKATRGAPSAASFRRQTVNGF